MGHRQAYFEYAAVTRDLIVTKRLRQPGGSEYSELYSKNLFELKYYLWAYLRYESSFSLLPKPLLGIFLV